MYTLWNPEPDAQDLLVTLRYGTSGQSYKLPVTLEGHASTMIDIGELIRTRQLDQDGNTLPFDVGQGSLAVGSPSGELEDAVNVVIGMGIYNPTKATCGSGTEYCNGLVNSGEVDSLFSLAVGGQKQQSLKYNDNLGYQYDVSLGSLWSSSNSGVLSVDNEGLVTGAYEGSAQIAAFYLGTVPVYAQIPWYGQEPPCPTSNFGGESTGTTVPEIDSVTPSTVGVGRSSVTMTLGGSGFGASPQVYIEQICNPCTGSGSGTSTSVTFSTAGAGAFLGDHDVYVIVNQQQSNTEEMTVACAVPTNYQISPAQNQPDGTLYFVSTWASSTGSLADLQVCTVGETVFYPGSANPYVWPLPMVASTANPTVLSSSGNNAYSPDHQYPPDSYQAPYYADGFQATQRLWWTCPCYQNDNIQQFMPDITISRQVFQDKGTYWKYQVSKLGYTNTVRLP